MPQTSHRRQLPNLRVERIYGSVPRAGEKRVLIDRLWPRGISKVKAHLDAWWKEIAPSTGLRKWFAHDPAKWGEFQERYRAELEGNPQAKDFANQIRGWCAEGPVVLLFGAKNTTENNAVVLEGWLKG